MKGPPPEALKPQTKTKWVPACHHMACLRSSCNVSQKTIKDQERTQAYCIKYNGCKLQFTQIANSGCTGRLPMTTFWHSSLDELSEFLNESYREFSSTKLSNLVRGKFIYKGYRAPAGQDSISPAIGRQRRR